MKIHGFDELINSLDDLSRKAKSISGENEVSFDELFPVSFMKKYTKFNSIDEFEEQSDFDFTDIENIDDAALDHYVSIHTNFSKWDDMLAEAGEQWTIRKLGL